MPSFASTILFTLVLGSIAAVKADAAEEIALLKQTGTQVAKVNLLADQDVSRSLVLVLPVVFTQSN